jgi:tRNA (guanine37-N1)-methyltransferase
MRIDVVTLFPQMFAVLKEDGITGRAVKSGLLTLGLWNPRDYASNSYRSVDDKPYGGGPGMVMLYQPLRDAIHAARREHNGNCRVFYLSPQGRRFTQSVATGLVAGFENIVLVAGRYEGVDERLIEQEIDEELSIGDYVLSGGEIAAMVVVDALTRLLPGALGHEDSALQDTFNGGLLEFPQYTRPEEIDGQQVPAVLLSGDHQAILRWRRKQALGRTWLKRPDLLGEKDLSSEERRLLEEYLDETVNKTG